MTKKQNILILFLLLFLGLFAQGQTARGYIYDKASKQALAGAEIKVYDAPIQSISNEEGEFVIEMPEGDRHVTISKENYYTLNFILDHDFQDKPIIIYLEDIKDADTNAHEIQGPDSIFFNKKNTISLSLIELGSMAIAVRYERFISLKHAVGLHASYYVRGQSSLEPYFPGSEPPEGATYTGFKAAPFYRFYPLRKKSIGLFVDAKIPFGYFDFDNLWYEYGSRSGFAVASSYNFWTWGGALSVGVMIPLRKTRQGVLNFSVGYQYFPMLEPDMHGRVNQGIVRYYSPGTDWWYKTGPGGRFEVKLTIGGIF